MFNINDFILEYEKSKLQEKLDGLYCYRFLTRLLNAWAVLTYKAHAIEVDPKQWQPSVSFGIK